MYYCCFCSCRNFDGGFGAVPGAESHAGQIFCCVGALSIGNALHLVDEDLLGWWLSERQCDSGGLNGRPEKQADVCYSWWILSSLTILGRVRIYYPCNVCLCPYISDIYYCKRSSSSDFVEAVY